MQREIAEVMASCALRGFRYIAFPPIVFEAPKPTAEPEHVVEPVAQANPAPEAQLSEAAAPPQSPAAMPPEPMTALAPEPPTAQPPEPAPHPVLAEPMAPEPSRPIGPAMRRLTEFAELAAEPEGPSLRARRLAELAGAESPDQPGEDTAPRRFALLNDIAVELRPRRVRARTGRRA